ncbi:MAG TPA: ATP-binding protein [Polyangiaceae bacterium]
MGLFPEDRLDVPEFALRLAALLGEARDRLGVRWLGVVELAVPGSRAGTVWRATSAGGEPELSLPAFERLASGPEHVPAGVPELRPHQVAAVVRAARVIRLEVAPRLHAGTDALLVMLDAEGAPADGVRELVRCLERGLSGERRARMANALLSAIDQAPDAMELTDRDGRLFYVNRAWERFTGHASADVIGRTVGQILRDPEAPLHDPAFYQFTMAELHAGRPWLGALAARRRDGGRAFSEVNVGPFADASAGMHGHVAIRRDLAHRSERDQALAQAHHEFRLVLAAITDGVCVLRDGRIYFTNAAFTSIVLTSEAGVIGRAFVDFVHPDDRAQFEQQHPSKVARVRVLAQGGAPRFVEISRAGAVSFEGKPATILFARDTTDYQLAREELSRAEKLSALGSLAAGVAHEINNPLAYVALNLELLADRAETLGEPEREALLEAIDGVSRMRAIAAELHTFSGSDGPGPPEPVDVSRALTSALNIAQNEIRHRAALVRNFENGLFVLAREGQLVQVLVNVLVNAAQAITEPSIDDQMIRVSSRARADGKIEIVVADTGAGIPANVLPHLFDPFSTSKRRGEGSGLGLAICRRIVQGFGGQIRIASTLGQGTTVTIELPETTRAPVLRPVRQKSTLRPREPQLRVLIVDDERSIARALRRILTAHEVVLAEDGQSALALIAASPDFDVVLCDLMMPGLSGAQVYEQACRQKPDIGARFVFMTGGAVTAASKEFLKTVEGRVLQKPFDPAAVLECVEQVARKLGQARDKAGKRRESSESSKRNYF